MRGGTLFPWALMELNIRDLPARVNPYRLSGLVSTMALHLLISLSKADDMLRLPKTLMLLSSDDIASIGEKLFGHASFFYPIRTQMARDHAFTFRLSHFIFNLSSLSYFQPLPADRLVILDIFRTALEDDAPLPHDIDALRNLQCDAQLLLHQQDRNAARGYFFN
jgi:hypothetical protein